MIKIRKKKAQVSPEVALRIFIAVIIIMALLGFGSGAINKVTEWFIPVFLSIILSIVAGAIIEGFGGGFLKTVTLTIPIWKFKFPVSVFTVLVFLIKYGFLR